MLAKINMGNNIELMKTLFAIADRAYHMYFTINASEFNIQLMDHAHVAMIEAYANRELVSELNATELNIVPDVEQVSKILKKVKKNSEVTLGIDKIGEKYTFTVGIKYGKVAKDYSFKAYEEHPHKVPAFSYDVEFVMPVKELYEYIDEISVFSDGLVIEVGEKDSVMFYPHVTEDERVSAIIEVDTEIERGTGYRAKAVFPINYFKSVKPLLKMYDEIKLQLKTDYPLVIRFGDEKLMEFMFALAPRTEY